MSQLILGMTRRESACRNYLKNQEFNNEDLERRVFIFFNFFEKTDLDAGSLVFVTTTVFVAFTFLEMVCFFVEGIIKIIIFFL